MEQQKSSKQAGSAFSPAKQRSGDKWKLIFKETRECEGLFQEIDALESEKEHLFYKMKDEPLHVSAPYQDMSSCI